MSEIDTVAIVMESPKRVSLRRLELRSLEPGDVVVEIEWSGISTGTERLLWSGRMPAFPGMGYPLVPGYESVGRVIDGAHDTKTRIGERVFVPGSSCFKDARGLFGGAARRIIVPGKRAIPIDESQKETGILIALAATAYHAIAGGKPPQLIVGHGVLGRLMARLTIAAGHPAPTVWETDGRRRDGAIGYSVIDPNTDDHRHYNAIYDASGDAAILDRLISRLASGGEIVLAGFYEKALSFEFSPAFIREARIRVAAEWKPEDLAAVQAAINQKTVSLDGLMTHRMRADEAGDAYGTAFGDASCLKMIIDWRGCA